MYLNKKIVMLGSLIVANLLYGSTTSGVVYATQPVLVAVDEHGNIDTDYTQSVTLSTASAGTLEGTLTKTFVAGRAAFTDVKYKATADNETYTLKARDGILSDATTDNITSEVIATQLSFTTQPNPTAILSSRTVDFSTDPIVKAVDADGLVDTDFTELVTLGENGLGTGTFTNNTATATAGVATFTGLTLNHSTAETMQLTANDEDGTGSNLPLGMSSNIVVSSNAAPVNTLPSSPTVAENSANTIIAGISIADSDGDSQTIILTVTNGTVSLSGTTSLTFTTGDGTDDASMVFSGTVANINIALNNLTFTPTANSTTTATFNIQTNDGKGGVDDDTLSINVTDQLAPTAPVINASNGTSITGTGEAGATVTVKDADGNTIGTAVVAANGSWTITPTTAIANGVVLTATQEDLAGNTSSGSSSQTVDSTDSDATLTAGDGVIEPVKLPSTADTVGEAVSLFDFTLTDSGTGDGFSTDVSQVIIHTSGTADFTKVTWKLKGTDVSDVTGTYDADANTLTFAGLSISIANGTSETYTVSGFFATPTGLTKNQTYIFSINGDDDLTVDQTKTKMSGTNSEVNNGTGTKIDILATKLRFMVLPAN
ncbi:MAG: Ig family protein [uncultured Sulfurovum sp.]|uniref:Ig family protein n=1 Tax=uncultured Sulfurovum sp. TaxID=269237 RepID=A0A6S6S1V6_9BACT|nr:MAG: Ig family protein [uncultured Sulfurovum sp.]